MGKLISKVSKYALAIMLSLSVITISTDAKETYEPGATVVEDANSPSGYTVHFVYDGSENQTEIESVSVTGPFNYVDANQTLKDDTNRYSPHEYRNGMYATNCVPGSTEPSFWDTCVWGYTEEMALNEETGYYETSFPITSGAFGYHYVIKYVGQEEAVTIGDPANPAQKMNENGFKNTGDLTTSIVYGHWDPVKQSESPNMDYVLPTANAKGKLEYVPYTGVDGLTNYLGVYTPAGYDANREEPYKVIYVSHGGGGDETDWFHMGSIDNIMDNYIEQGLIEPAIVVTMDNTHLDWDSGSDISKVLPNIKECIIPFMEENYNVSKEASGRAMCGLSAGGMTTTKIYWQCPELFGYFGIFSGTSVIPEQIQWQDGYASPLILTTVGTCDFASSLIAGEENEITVESFDRWAKENIPDTYVTKDMYVKGSHDWFVWPQSFAVFARDVIWTNDTAVDEEPVTVTGTQKVYVVGDDWGAGVTKTIISLSQKVKAESISADQFTVDETKEVLDWSTFEATVSTSTRTVLDVYASDASGNKVNEDSEYLTIEMKISPEEGSPLVLTLEKLSAWCDPYKLQVTLAKDALLTTVDGKSVILEVEAAIDLEGEGKIVPQLDIFEVYKGASAYVYTTESNERIELPYALYCPNNDGKKHPVVIWNHGGGESGFNPETVLLSNPATNYAGEEFQNIFDGAYVVVPQITTIDNTYRNADRALAIQSLILDLAKENPDMDLDRVYVAGCSAGGLMTLKSLITTPDFYAAAVLICPAVASSEVTDEEIEKIKDIPLWFVHSKSDDTVVYDESTALLIPRLEAAGAKVYTSIYEHVVDESGRLWGTAENPTVLSSENTGIPYEYPGHWSWIYFENNLCVDDKTGINCWEWLASKKKTVINTPDPDKKPVSTTTGDTAVIMPFASLALLSLAGCVMLSKKRETLMK